MSSRGSLGSVAGAMVFLALLAACGGGKPKETGAASPAPATAPEATPQAANDPVADPAVPGRPLDYDPATAAGAVKGIPSPTNSAPIEAVANFYTDLPGFDLAPLSTRQREKFLHRVNSELCTCGCTTDTLAHCLVNDPKCPVVKGMVQTVYDELKSGS